VARSPGGVFHDVDLLLREAVQLVDETVDLPVGRLDLAREEGFLVAKLSPVPAAWPERAYFRARTPFELWRETSIEDTTFISNC